MTAMSDMPSIILFSIFQPSSVWAISRPLKRTVTLALLPSSRKRRTCLALKSKSCVSVLGPSLTSLTWIVVCFFRASFCRRDCMYLYLPTSMIRPTGGRAPADAPLRRHIEPLLDRHDPQLLAVGAHDPHVPHPNAFIDPDVL